MGLTSVAQVFLSFFLKKKKKIHSGSHYVPWMSEEGRRTRDSDSKKMENTKPWRARKVLKLEGGKI